MNTAIVIAAPLLRAIVMAIAMTRRIKGHKDRAKLFSSDLLS